MSRKLIKARNSASWLARVDGRSHVARHARATFAALANDLGGQENCSEAEQILLRRAAILDAELSKLEEKICTNDKAVDPEDLDLYGRTANTLRRLLETTGLKRRAKDVTPSLAQYQAELAREPVTIDAEVADD